MGKRARSAAAALVAAMLGALAAACAGSGSEAVDAAPDGAGPAQDAGVRRADAAADAAAEPAGDAGDRTPDGGAEAACAGPEAWTRIAGGSSRDFARAIDVAADCSVLVTGFFRSDVTVFGRGEPAETALASRGGYDVFLARFRSDGTLAWARSAGGALEHPDPNVLVGDFGQAVVAASDGGATVLGDFMSAATFGAGEAAETTLPDPDGTRDVFLARFDRTGALAWAVPVARAAPGAYATGVDVAVGPSGFYVLGGYHHEITLGWGEASQATLGWGSSGDDLFLARYDGNGRLVWARRASGPLSPTDLAVADDGSAWVTGQFYTATGESRRPTFEDGASGAIELEGYGQFLARYEPDGRLAWVRRVSVSSTNGFAPGFSSLAVTPGGVTVSGSFRGDAVLLGEGGPGVLTAASSTYGDMFVARYDAAGEALWVRRVVGDGSGNVVGHRAIARASEVAVLGGFTSAATFDPGAPGERTLAAGRSFLAYYGDSGALTAVESLDTPGGIFSSGLLAAGPDGRTLFVVGSPWGAGMDDVRVDRAPAPR